MSCGFLCCDFLPDSPAPDGVHRRPRAVADLVCGTRNFSPMTRRPIGPGAEAFHDEMLSGRQSLSFSPAPISPAESSASLRAFQQPILVAWQTTEWSKLRSIVFESENHLNSPPGADTTAVCRTAARCTENTPINRPAYSRCSDSISARPLAAYIRVKVGESLDNARSTLGLMRRMGWRASFPLISNTTLPRWPILPHGAYIGAIFNTLPGEPAISRTSGLRRCRLRCPSSCRMRHRFRCGCTWGRGCCDGGPRCWSSPQQTAGSCAAGFPSRGARPKSVPVCPYNRWTFPATPMLRGLLQVQPALRAQALGSSPERFVCEL